MTPLPNAAAVETAVRKAVEQVTITDIHTHLFPPNHDGLLLWGIDEMLTYHYLVAELFTVAPGALTPQAFWKLPKQSQADAVWEHVFLRHGGLSEAARGVITTLGALGLDVAGRDLKGIRRWFAAQKIEDYLPKVFSLAGLDYAIMTNDPFVAREVACWDATPASPACLKTALRIDTLLVDWPAAVKTMTDAGYSVGADGDEASIVGARKFLHDWAERLQPVYLAASLPPQFAYPDNSPTTTILERVVLPEAKELNIPLALMIGVRKAVNPLLGDGGDGVGVADLAAVQHLCQKHPDVKFLITVLSRVNQHELGVLARKFGNLHVFGCWWFCNIPSIIEEVTRLRIELLGTAFTCQHSDARVLDQLVYKWAHARKIVADVLAETYRDQFRAGWRASNDEIHREVRTIFGGGFEEFCAKSPSATRAGESR